MRRTLRAATAVAGLAMLALAIAACTGGDDDAEQPSTATATAAPASTATPAAASTPSPTPTATATATAAATATPDPTPTEAPTQAAPALPVTVTDADGEEVVIEDISRLVVLNGVITEVVFALGLGANIAGVDITSTYPPEVEELPRVGPARELHAEGIISLGPTLVIGNTSVGPPEVLEQVRSVGIPVLIMPEYNDLDEIGVKITSIAEALGVPRRGERLAAAAEASIAGALAQAEAVESRPRVAFLYLRGSQTQLLGGEGSGADSLIAAAGGIDVGVEAGVRGFIPITPEALVAANPEVLLLFASGLEMVGGIDGLLEIPGVAQTEAGRNRAVVAFDGLYLLGYGPRTGAALAELIAAFHPDLE